MSNIDGFDEKYGGMGFTHRLGEIVFPSIVLSTGVFALDIAHGIGGVRTGSVVQIVGAEALGKSSISYRILANGLRQGMSGIVIDTESGFNEPVLVKTLTEAGIIIDGENLYFEGKKLNFRYATSTNLRDVRWVKGDHGDMKPSPKTPVLTFERIVPMIEEFIVSEEISPNGAIIIIDSLDMLLSDTMVGSAIDEATVALVAKRMKNWLKRFTGTIRRTGSMLITTHQRMANIVTGFGAKYAEKETYGGGFGLRHMSHFTIKLVRKSQAKEGGEVVGQTVVGTIIKTKQGGECWRTFEYDIRHDIGIDNISSILEIAKRIGIIEASGPSIKLTDQETGEVTTFKGVKRFRAYMNNHPEVLRSVENEILKHAKDNLEDVAPSIPVDERPAEENEEDADE